MSQQWTDSLVQGLKKQFEDANHSDLIIKVGDIQYKVHKLVFCTLSKFFAKACDNFKEADSGTIELKHGDVKTLHHLITWFKTGEYCDGQNCQMNGNKGKEKASGSDDETNSETAAPRKRTMWLDEIDGDDSDAGSIIAYDIDDRPIRRKTCWPIDEPIDKPILACQHPVTFDIEVFALADFYDIEALRKQVAENLPTKLERVLPTHRYGPLTQSFRATTKKARKKRNEDEEDVDDDSEQIKLFCDAVRAIYTSTPENERGLRDIVVEEAVDRYQRLAAFTDFLDLLVELPEFNKDMAFDVGKMLRTKNNKICATCNKRVNDRPCPCAAPSVNHWGRGDWAWIPRQRSEYVESMWVNANNENTWNNDINWPQ